MTQAPTQLQDGTKAPGLMQINPRPSIVLRPLTRFVLRRLLGAVVTLLVVSILIFTTVQIIPGDVARVILGRTASPEALSTLRSELGLERPLFAQYFDWVSGVLSGDLGDSAVALASKSADPSVWSAIQTPLINSAYLAAITILVLVPAGFLLGTWAAVHVRRSADNIISTTAVTLGAMPEFLVGTILIVIFFSWLNVLPPISQVLPGETPLSYPEELILPVTTLLAICLSFVIRMVRAGVLDSLKQDYVTMARLNGLPERRVVWRYALRNALAPGVQAIAQTVTYLAGGIIITESVFNYPGIGRKLVQAVASRDITTVASITLILAALYIIVNLIADLIVVLIVPKLRTSL
jgi:peptide/nickel transport system permease protein